MNETPAKLRREFIIERSGKPFVLYAGLLDKAHEDGLRAIRTTLLQIPDDSNDQVAICQAVVEMGDGKTFSGLGDASPRNVPRPMVEALIRFAETRAKARALRDAVNVGMVALEELGLDEDAAPASGQRPGPRAVESPRPTTSEPPPNFPPDEPRRAASGPVIAAPVSAGGSAATPAQVKAIYAIGRNELQMGVSEVDSRSMDLYGCLPAELTKRQASEYIDRLRSSAA